MIIKVQELQGYKLTGLYICLSFVIKLVYSCDDILKMVLGTKTIRKTTLKEEIHHD